MRILQHSMLLLKEVTVDILAESKNDLRLEPEWLKNKFCYKVDRKELQNKTAKFADVLANEKFAYEIERAQAEKEVLGHMQETMVYCYEVDHLRVGKPTCE